MTTPARSAKNVTELPLPVTRRNARMAIRWAGLGMLLALPLLSGCPAPPDVTFTVNSTNDTVDTKPGDGVCADACEDCTLRAAIMEANAWIYSGANIITVPAGRYKLTIPGPNENAAATGDLDITRSLTIKGAGAATTVIDAGALDRALHVVAGSVTISGVTITRGNSGDDAIGGGGIRNAGTLILNDTVVAGNSSRGGGGIFNEGASSTLTLNNSTVSGNTAAGAGGIYNYFGKLVLNNSTIDRNTAGGIGGIRNSAGNATLNNSTVSRNTATHHVVGGIMNDCSGGGQDSDHFIATLTLNNSTVSGNTAVTYGGGILNESDKLRGCNGAVITLNSSTVTGNTAGAYGGGIAQYQDNTPVYPATITLKNSIVADNIGNPGPNCSGTIDTSLGHNLSSDGTCGSGPGVLVSASGLDPLLRNNLGPTETHALLPGSKAIDAGDCPPGADQRGVVRPRGAGCDIGAYEASKCP